MTEPIHRTNVTNNAPAKPPELSDKAIRLECVKQAVLLEVASSEVVSVAALLTHFVVNGA